MPPTSRDPRTSVSHPLRVDAVGAGPASAGGLIGMTFCPGKCGESLFGRPWKRSLAIDLDAVAAWRPDVIVTLVEPHELVMLGVADLGAQIQRRGIPWYHLPIVDVGTPDATFEARWREVGPLLLGILRRGGRVLVHCRGGLGRAGTVAARLLVELGEPAGEAIVRVRQARPGAIETAAQAQYVLSLVAPHDGGG